MFQNQTAIVTGASSGFGLETTLLLAEQGATVYAVARRQGRLTDLAEKNPNVIPVVQDLTQPLDTLTATIAGKRIDILVNNAGLAWGRDSIESAPRYKWETMIDTNVKALIAVTQLVLPSMIASGSGDIVNIGSIAAFEGYAGGFGYCATKFAVRGITDSMRHDLFSKNIRVMGIHPGLAETEFSEVRFDGDKEKAKAVYAGMAPLTAKDIAETIVWSLSRPRHVNIASLLVLPTDQASAGNTFRR